MTWLNHWYQWQFAHYCIIALLAPTFDSLSLNRLSQHPQLPSLITPWANTTTPQDTSRKGCASPCASRSTVVQPSCKESWRNGCGLHMAYASHKPPLASPWNVLMSCWRWQWTPVSCPRNLHCVPVKLCSTHRWSLHSNTTSLSSRTRSTWTETCYTRRRHASCKSFILMLQKWRSHKAGWKSSKTDTGSSHFVVLGKAARWTWKQLARCYQTSAPLLMRTQRRTCSTWRKLPSIGVSKPITRWQPINWKAGRSTRSASLLSFAQTRTAAERFRWRSWASTWIHVVSRVSTAIRWAPVITLMQRRGWPRTSFDSSC